MTEENGKTEVSQDEVETPLTKGPKKQGSKKDWLSVGGIGLEKRRRSSAASYRIENNKVVIETEDGEIQELEIVSSQEKHGSFRKAVPVLPVPIAVLCLVLNIIPGLGTFLSGLLVMCGYKTEYNTKAAGVCWNVLAAVLQVILAPIVVGLIWSVQRGVILVQESLNKKIEEREEREDKVKEDEKQYGQKA